ncbi:hypothetical protein HKD37_15G044085 [Glycine soja]
MVESTRSKTSVDRLEDAIAKLTASQFAMNSKIDDLLHRMSQLEAHQLQPQPLTPPSSSTGHTPSHNPQHRMKLDVPRFDGSDPTGWIFKITQFFEYHATPEQERLTIASFYMEGPALAWFQWMHQKCRVLQPISLAQAVSYARLQEEKLLDAHRPSSDRSPSTTAGTMTTHSSSANPTPSLLPTPVRTSPFIPFKRLTPEELAIRQERGLCFQCDEKFSRGHKCASSLFLLITEDNGSTLESVQMHVRSPIPDLLPEPSSAQVISS